MCDTWWHFLVSHVFYTLPAEIYVGALIPYPRASWSGFPGVERSAVCFETGSLSLLASIWRPWFFFTFRNLSQLVTVPRRSDHTSILLASSCWSHQTQPQRLTFYIPLLPWKPLWGLQVGPPLIPECVLCVASHWAGRDQDRCRCGWNLEPWHAPKPPLLL